MNENENNVSLVSTSREKIHLLLANLFKKTFGEQSNLDKTSFNAWVLERLTDIERDIALSMTLNKEEQFLNSCKNISSVRRIGYNYNFSDFNVSASIGTLSFKMALPSNFRSQKLTISADNNKIYANELPFMFPGNIEVTADDRGNIQAVRRTNHIFDTTDNTILYSTSLYNKDTDQIIFAFSSEVMQCDFVDDFLIIEEHTVMTNAENEISFNDNYLRIEIWYDYFDEEKNETLTQKLTQVNEFVHSTGYDEVFKVEIIDSNKLKVIFGNGINGKYYAAGKELKYRLFTTKGSQGNLINPNLSVAVDINLSEISTAASFIFDPVGGQDEFSLLELKQAIIKKIQSSDKIITDNDLKNNLSNILGLDSEEIFQKLRRNDPIERILELFIIVKDSTKNSTEYIIPTNTIDVDFNTASFTDNEYLTLKPFFLIENSSSKDDDGNIVRTSKIIPKHKSKSPRNNYYSNYYAMKFKKNPLSVNFFNLNTNYSLSYENTYTNTEQTDEVYINSFILERDVFKNSNQYFFRIVLDSINKKFLDTNTLIIKAKFKNISTERKYDDFVIEFYKTDVSNIYEAKITSLDIISDSNNLFIKDVFKKEQTLTDGTENWLINTKDFETEIVDSLDCEICIFYNFDTGIPITNDAFKYDRSVRTLLLLSSYKSENISLYQNIDNIIYCQLEKDSRNKDILRIKDLPVYEDNYINAAQNKEAIKKQMEIEFNMSDKIQDKMELPSRLSLKYFNTYGYSNLYSDIENVSLKLEFEVSYRNNKIISTTEEEEIKNNLIKFIDKINKKSIAEDKNIYLSDLITIVTANPNIIQCRLLNYNDNIFYQYDNTKNFNYIPASLQLEPKNIIFKAKTI